MVRSGEKEHNLQFKKKKAIQIIIDLVLIL